MPHGHVLVIEDDELVSLLLASAIRDAGFQVTVSATAAGGLDLACAARPDCIVCDVTLPDHDGFWVAKNVRTHPSSVSVTPFLFLSGLADHESRLAGFHVGADVYLTKPFRVDEVIAQVDALVQMAWRLRGRRDSLLMLAEGPEATAIEGDLGLMSIATLLSVLELERRTGTIDVTSKKRRAQLEISGGFAVQGVVGGTSVSALLAIRTMLAWKVGRFSFRPSLAQATTGGQKSIGAFLLEAARLQDEDARVELQLPPSRSTPLPAKLSPPILGGPPCSPADLGPPSVGTSRAEPRGPSSRSHAREPGSPRSIAPSGRSTPLPELMLDGDELVEGWSERPQAPPAVAVEEARSAARLPAATPTPRAGPRSAREADGAGNDAPARATSGTHALRPPPLQPTPRDARVKPPPLVRPPRADHTKKG